MLLSLKSIVLGIIQGLTEFLPISSTGHMIIAEEYLTLPQTFRETFLVVVQLGSILSVIVYFFRRLLPADIYKDAECRKRTFRMWLKVIAGVLPAIVLGGLFGSAIKHYLYSTPTVAISLFIGGILLILLEKRKPVPKFTDMESLPYIRVLGIGLAQSVAMIPGVSRSAATILGALCLGTSRELAVEYSFFLAIPTMFAASAYSLMKDGASLTAEQWMATAAGFVTAFAAAWAVIAFLMAFIKKRDFQIFGWYRIVLAILLMAWMFFLKR